MENIIEFKRERDIPNDLMTFGELKQKHGFSYDWLYKWCCRKKEIKTYYRGRLKASESEVLLFAEMRSEKWRA